MTNIRYVVAISPLSPTPPMSSASPPPGSPQSGRPKVLGWSPCRRRKASLTRRRSAETLAEPGRDHQQHEHHHKHHQHHHHYKHHQHHHHLIVIISSIFIGLNTLNALSTIGPRAETSPPTFSHNSRKALR